MRSTLLAIALTSILLLPLAPAAGAEDWPHWRGPERRGVADAEGLPTSWTASENVRWKLALPELSGSTPIIWGDQIFLNVADGEQLQLWSVDRGSGEVGWRRPLGAGNVEKRKGNMSSPSPVTDGSGVWVMTGTGVLSAFSMDGEPRWQRNLQQEYGAIGVLHGYSSSPLLDGDSLYVQVLHGFHTDDPSYVLRIDKATGKNRWRIERPTDAPRESPDAYTTPAILTYEGGQRELVISGADYVTGHDLESGEELWRVGGLNPEKLPFYRIVASPVVYEGMVYVPSRVKPLLALAATEPGTVPAVAWRTDDGPDVPTPVATDRYLFIVDDKGIASCLDRRDGSVVWQNQRLARGAYSASPVVADGKLYITNEDGVTSVIKAGPEFELLSENNVGEYTLSTIAVAGDTLFLRTAEHLYALATGTGDGAAAKAP